MTDTTRRPCPPDPISGTQVSVGGPKRGTIRVEVLVPGGNPSMGKPVDHVIEIPDQPGPENRLYARRLALTVANDVERILMSGPPFGPKEES